MVRLHPSWSSQPADEEREQGLFMGNLYGRRLEEVPIISTHISLARILIVWGPETVISQACEALGLETLSSPFCLCLKSIQF